MDVHYMELQINARLAFSISLVKTSKKCSFSYKAFRESKNCSFIFWKGNFDFARYANRRMMFWNYFFPEGLISVEMLYIYIYINRICALEVNKLYFSINPLCLLCVVCRHPNYTFNKNLVHLIYIRRLHF